MTETWCPIPWIFQAVRSNGDLRICCQANITPNKGVLRKDDGSAYNAARDDMSEARNSQLMKAVRRNMLDGIWSEECGRCLREENAGLSSRRQYEKELWPTVTVDGMRALTADDGSIDVDALPVSYLDLRFGNLCNLGCRMCGPTDSTGWYEDWVKLTGQTSFTDTHGEEQLYQENGKWRSDSYGWHGSDNFWQQLESTAGSIRHVYMAGGEPLLIERHYEFLERCVQLGAAKDIIIEYNTNMSSIPARVLDLWKNFKKILIGASIDGYGSVFEYQRYPADWNKVWRNIQKVDQASGNITPWFAYTVTAYNVMHMIDFMRWKLCDSGLEKFNSTKRRPIVTYHMAHNPPHLNVRMLPLAYKHLVIARLNEFADWTIQQGMPENVAAQARNIADSIRDYMMAVDTHDQHWEEFCQYTRQLDRIRGQDIGLIAPELAGFMA